MPALDEGNYRSLMMRPCQNNPLIDVMTAFGSFGDHFRFATEPAGIRKISVGERAILTTTADMVRIGQLTHRFGKRPKNPDLTMTLLSSSRAMAVLDSPHLYHLIAA